MHKYEPMSLQKCNMDLQVITMIKKQNASMHKYEPMSMQK